MRQSSVVRFVLALALVATLAVDVGIGPDAADAAQQGPAASADVVPGEVVIQYRRGVRPAERGAARSRVRASRKASVRLRNGEERELAALPPGLAVADAVRSLRADPAVAFVEPN